MTKNAVFMRLVAFRKRLVINNKRGLEKIRIRACLKKHSRNLYAPLCGIFCPNSVVIARCDALLRTKSPANCDAYLAESLFPTRSAEERKSCIIFRDNQCYMKKCLESVMRT